MFVLIKDRTLFKKNSRFFNLKLHHFHLPLNFFFFVNQQKVKEWLCVFQYKRNFLYTFYFEMCWLFLKENVYFFQSIQIPTRKGENNTRTFQFTLSSIQGDLNGSFDCLEQTNSRYVNNFSCSHCLVSPFWTANLLNWWPVGLTFTRRVHLHNRHVDWKKPASYAKY